MVVLISIPGSPGFSSLSARSTPRVTSNVLKPGNFSIASIRPGFSDDGVSDQRLMPLHEIGDIADARGRAAERHLGEGSHGGDRQLVTDAEPLVRRFDEAAGAGRG